MMNSEGLNAFQGRKTTSDMKRAHCPTCNSHLSLGHICRAKGNVMWQAGRCKIHSSYERI